MEEADLQRIENEARAKMTWGESPENVLTFLYMQGLDGPVALEMMENLKQERAASVRGQGIKRIVVGSLMVACPIVTLVVCMIIGYIPIKLVSLTVLLGLWGVWKIIGGCINIFAPGFGNEDLSEG